MTHDFKPFGQAIARQFENMSEGELFVAGIEPEFLWNHYLESFPEGTNPVYRQRTEHDCSCCRAFVKHVGAVVTVNVVGQIASVWDAPGLQWPYSAVAERMSALVKTAPVTSVFRSRESRYGATETRELLEDKTVRKWDHFCAAIRGKHFCHNPEQVRGELNTVAQLLQRGLEELSSEALDTVLGLVDGKALYRGEEHRRAVVEFMRLQDEYRALPNDAHRRRAFCFAHCHNPAARFRNTVIGTLVQDLSTDVPLENAVRSFELKVAPTHYKRTTSLITPRMVQDAMKTVDELNLRLALERRLARVSDLRVGNVLWVDNSTAVLMRGGVESALMAAAKVNGPAPGSKAQDIDADDFVANMLPTARSIELLVRNSHATNFVTLTAPKHEGQPQLFKWHNDFAWSYDGNVTDSIREKVKSAGGNVDAQLRFSLAWHNHDDLDLHVIEPRGTHIYFGNKIGRYGRLDVDMNVGGNLSREPVENVAFARAPDGEYKVHVNQYNRRETADTGFTVQVVCGPSVQEFSCPQSPSRGDTVVGTFVVHDGAIVRQSVGPRLSGGGISLTKWGVRTETLVKVRTVLLSPNHWDGQRIGNRHLFFVLEGCRTSEPVRGIYNEFLSSDLEKHRKVFEVLGDKTKCEPAEDQLSGLGFSSTRGDAVTLTVATDRGTRVFNVRF